MPLKPETTSCSSSIFMLQYWSMAPIIKRHVIWGTISFCPPSDDMPLYSENKTLVWVELRSQKNLIALEIYPGILLLNLAITSQEGILITLRAQLSHGRTNSHFSNQVNSQICWSLTGHFLSRIKRTNQHEPGHWVNKAYTHEETSSSGSSINGEIYQLWVLWQTWWMCHSYARSHWSRLKKR